MAAQVATGADRHNLRGERISIDTIPLIGEAERAVTRLPRAAILVLAGSIVGGEIAAAVRELRSAGVPVITLIRVGSAP